MYGWLNECLKGMILSYYGEELWLQIIQQTKSQRNEWDIKEYLSDESFFELNFITAEILGIDYRLVKFSLFNFSISLPNHSFFTFFIFLFLLDC